jgi:catechol 2,3-dioxygenase-like lactoylglutathione lyase family enzyme
MTGLVKKVHHVAYRCKDAKQTVEWYGKYLGMKFILAIAEDAVPSTGEADPYMHVFLDAGGGNILAFFELPTRPENGPRPEHPGLDPAPGAGSRQHGGTAGGQGAARSRRHRGGRPDRPCLVPVDLLLRSERPPPRTGLQHPHAGNDEAARRSEVGHDQRVGGDKKGAAARALDARRQLQDLGARHEAGDPQARRTRRHAGGGQPRPGALPDRGRHRYDAAAGAGRLGGDGAATGGRV